MTDGHRQRRPSRPVIVPSLWPFARARCICGFVASPSILETYVRLRKTRRSLNDRIVKTLSKMALEETAKHLGLFATGAVVADSEADLDRLMDSAIYDY